jgi:adenylate kinase
MNLPDGSAFNLILLGDVGAGKATQSAYIAKKYKMLDFDMGRELTLLRQKNSGVDRIQKRTADQGILTPTTIVRGLLTKKIKTTPAVKGILFDGHPKMIGEAKLVTKLLRDQGRSKPLVIYLTIPAQETVKRIKARQGYLHTKFRKRSDDTATGLKNRAVYYRKQINKVTKYLSEHYQFVRVNGQGTKAQVRSRIQKAITAYLKEHAQVH